MTTRRTPRARQPPPPPTNVFDDDELIDDVDADDLQPATTSVQLANAIHSAPPVTLRHSTTSRAPKPRPSPKRAPVDELIVDDPLPAPPPQQSAVRRVRSSPKAALSPTSFAAFDPLTSPATRSTASRVLVKRSSLNLPSAAAAHLSHAADPFAHVEAAPPPYEQVLLSDDIIAAQFTQLSVDDLRTFDVGLGTPTGSVTARTDAKPTRGKPKPRWRYADTEEVKQVQEADEDGEERAADENGDEPHVEEVDPEPEPVRVEAPVVRRKVAAVAKAPPQPMEEEDAEEDLAVAKKPVARAQRRRPQPTPTEVEEALAEEEQWSQQQQRQQQPVVRVGRRITKRIIPHRALRQPVEEEVEEEPEPVVVAPPPRARVMRTARPVELKRRAEEEEEDEEVAEEEEEEQEMEEEPPRRPARRAPAIAAEQQRRRTASRDVADDEDEKAVAPRQPRPAQRRTSSSSSSASSSARPSPPVMFRPARVKVDALAFMMAGTPFLKYTSSFLSSPPHFRQFQLIPQVPASVVWFSENKPLSDTSIPLVSITSIVLGQSTPSFQRHRAVELESMSWSILYTDERGRERSLDLTAKDRNELHVWYEGLSRAVALVKARKPLDARRRVVVDIKVVYGGSPSQQLVEVDTGRVVDTRKKSELRERERKQRTRSGDAGEELEGVGQLRAVDSSLYRELQPRFAALQVALAKRKEELKLPKVMNSTLHANAKAMLRKVELKTRVIADALMDGELAVADSQLWLANIELDAVGAMITSIRA